MSFFYFKYDRRAEPWWRRPRTPEPVTAPTPWADTPEGIRSRAAQGRPTEAELREQIEARATELIAEHRASVARGMEAISDASPAFPLSAREAIRRGTQTSEYGYGYTRGPSRHRSLDRDDGPSLGR